MKQSILSILKKIKSELNLEDDITNDRLLSVILSISRVADKKITNAINTYKKQKSIKISANEKNIIKEEILGLKTLTHDISIKDIITEEDKSTAVNLILNGMQRNKDKVLGTIKAKLTDKNKNKNIRQYLDIISEEEKNHNQLIVLNINSTISTNQLLTIINQEYDSLSNYHFMAIIFRNSSWEAISDIAISCEFLKKENNFSVFNRHKTEKIDELDNFIKGNHNIKYSNKIFDAIEEFFDGVSYGFQFNDLLVSKNSNTKILILQKIKLDETIIPCPACMSKNVRGNSYPKMLQKSYECQNPFCPSRSKIGRGKRFDYFGVKRNTYLSINDTHNKISGDIQKKYRRDIFIEDNSLLEMLITFYSFAGNNIKIISDNIIETESFGRNITFSTTYCYNTEMYPTNALEKILSEVIKNIEIQETCPQNSITTTNYALYHGNSSEVLKSIPEKISSAITSPPYYNAREYSQWPSLICYLIDMAINAKAVFSKINPAGLYFYNIGDIVNQDNIFVSSHMSSKRLMLGFFSMLIFKLVGFDFKDNIIWDKGEVQSKRNSTDNIFPTYVHPINCYEHILVFSKSYKNKLNLPKIVNISPVKKINSKGENILGHTAPYPEELVKMALPYMNTKHYILDPFLGSGTTIIACLSNKIKSVGIEYNYEYFNLSAKRISEFNKNKLS